MSHQSLWFASEVVAAVVATLAPQEAEEIVTLLAHLRFVVAAEEEEVVTRGKALETWRQPQSVAEAPIQETAAAMAATVLTAQATTFMAAVEQAGIAAMVAMLGREMALVALK